MSQYLKDLMMERELLDERSLAFRLVQREIQVIREDDAKRGILPSPYRAGEPRIGLDAPSQQENGQLRNTEFIKLKEKVMVPVTEHPDFNFVGKILGPRGNTLRRLQDVTGTKMGVFGRGSMKDKEKEEELRNGDDPKYNHLKEDLHVLIVSEGPADDAKARMELAKKELQPFLTPNSKDEISEQQRREMGAIKSGKEPLAMGGPMRGLPGNFPPGAIIIAGPPPPGIASGVPVIAGGLAPPRPGPSRYAPYESRYDAAYDRPRSPHRGHASSPSRGRALSPPRQKQDYGESYDPYRSASMQ